MYRKESKKITIEDFSLPIAGHLNMKNRWVILAALVPWEEFEEEYAKKFSINGMGAPAKPFRMALGAELIRMKLNITDEEVVNQIMENPYLQFFIGMERYSSEAPFDQSMMTHFRERLPLDMINRVNERVIENEAKKKELKETVPKEGEGEIKNKGKLLLDATCIPQDIRYPTDLSLLNEAREKTEGIIDRLHEANGKEGKKPRTYRKKARKEYVKIVKQGKKNGKTIRGGIRKLLGYLRRNLKTIKDLAGKVGNKIISKAKEQEPEGGPEKKQELIKEQEENIGNKIISKAKEQEPEREPEKKQESIKEQQENIGKMILSKKGQRTLQVCEKVFEQQEEMYKEKAQRIEDRIVSISQPHVRPIKRGKAGAETEFGSKILISVVEGNTRLEKLAWDNYNEGKELIGSVESYKKRYGFYPESVHVDKIFLTKDNRNYCKGNGIRITGPPLGRPSSDEKKTREAKKLEAQDGRDRIPVEGKFGNCKRKYGLNRIFAKKQDTSECEIAVGILLLNLDKQLRCCLSAISHESNSNGVIQGNLSFNAINSQVRAA